jgi:hypothetical protein
MSAPHLRFNRTRYCIKKGLYPFLRNFLYHKYGRCYIKTGWWRKQWRAEISQFKLDAGVLILQIKCCPKNGTPPIKTQPMLKIPAFEMADEIAITTTEIDTGEAISIGNNINHRNP